MWNILGEGPLKRTDEADDEAVILLFGADDLDEGPLAWQERALCAQTDPEAFFPEKGGSTREDYIKNYLIHGENQSQLMKQEKELLNIM